MLKIRFAEERGHANFGWLDSHHSFSFGRYYDPEHMGFGALRVINDDQVHPDQGFGTHGHENMEIISYVLQGELAHEDSLGNGSVIVPGDVQRMTAGTGIRHSEFNASNSDPLRFLQIWVIPDTQGLEPGYEQKHFGDDRQETLRLVVSKDARDGSLKIHQDMDVYAAVLQEGQTVKHSFSKDRQLWIQIADGVVELNGQSLRRGDGAAITDETEIALIANSNTEILLFDMPVAT